MNIKKICDTLGISPETIEVKLTAEDRRRSKVIIKFIRKIEKAHKKAAKSKLRFSIIE